MPPEALNRTWMVTFDKHKERKMEVKKGKGKIEMGRKKWPFGPSIQDSSDAYEDRNQIPRKKG